MRREPSAICRELDRLWSLGTVAAMTDSQLLETFVAGDDESAKLAFEAIVERHGAMVLRVCRLILKDAHAAEDAFQATFLVLARKARALRSRELLSHWLYGVATRTARKARAITIRRLARDRNAVSCRSTAVVRPRVDAGQDELERILHEEIDRLPPPYRAAVIVCYLEGLSHAQAALQLRLAETTIRGRLARARKLLGRRLVRRGVVPSLGLAALIDAVDAVPGALAQITAERAFSFVNRCHATSSLVSTTARGIAEGVLFTMWSGPFKMIVVTVAALGFLGAGSALLAQRPTAVKGPLAAIGAQDARAPLVHPDLVKLAPGPIVRAVPVSRDCMILAYLPDWNFGNVDNIGIGNNDGGVRTLLDWPDIAAAEAASPDRQFLIAFYARKTISHPPASAIHAFEILAEWPERTSWKTQPRYDAEPAATFQFEPGGGWKLFDVSSMVRARAKTGRKGHGVLLRFLNEDVSDRTQEVFSDYKIVSREGAGEWADRRPVLLVVEATKKAKPSKN